MNVSWKFGTEIYKNIEDIIRNEVFKCILFEIMIFKHVTHD